MSTRYYTSLATQKLGIFKVYHNHITVYPTPANLNYAFNFGSLAGFVLFSQIVTGILLAMHYTAHVDYAFSSVIHLMTDVPSGAILRYTHANGASLFFTVVYLHIFRGMYYSSGNQPRELVWLTGIVILLLMIITAFIGYVLPYGQMSIWGCTVITNLVTVIPVVGNDILAWLVGGFSIDQPTLNRFYSFHYTLPFILAGLSIFHIAALHQYGSTNPLGVNTQGSTIPFATYFATKDIIGLIFLLILFVVLVFFYPEVLGHPDNLIPANPYSTPAHIVPEWYFLWVYAILRSIPNKAMGVIFIALTFAALISLPFLSLIHVGSPKFRVVSERLFWLFVADVFLLTWLGGQEINPSTVLLGQLCTFVLFVYLLVIYPFFSWFESLLFLNTKTKLA